VLILAVLLYYKRFLSYTSDSTAYSISDCYLADLDILLNSEFLCNQRTVLKRVNFLFLQVLVIFGNWYQNIIQLLAVVFNKDLLFSELFDELTQYIVEKIKNRYSYLSVCKEITDQQSIINISENFCIIKFSELISKNIRRINTANIANLDKEFS